MLGSSNKPRIALVMPTGRDGLPHDISEAWHNQEWHADPKTIEITHHWQRRCGSLVDSFNTLWWMSLNARDNGSADLMAMIHDDVWAESWWINTLYSEMRLRNAAVISANVAIRDHERGRTSTAVAPACDSFSNSRCLNLDEIDRLPATFGPSHVCRKGEVLLINTGCMLIDLRYSDWDEWTWPQDCGIKWVKGQRTCKLRSEDWQFSRFLHERKIRYLCTRKVETRHYGLDYWSNRQEAKVPHAERNGHVKHQLETITP